ncbi:hypothetical protein ACFFX0_22940 [Citricoccus parietis]|uniref:Uncharacterized protein n=1 Tax=Citricoccus parietis TaxID=592307 RepID=A0ABV5G4Q2_9MICC
MVLDAARGIMPARCSAAASPTPGSRCPYVSTVSLIVLCLSTLDTTATSTPAAIIRDAVPCRRSCSRARRNGF